MWLSLLGGAVAAALFRQRVDPAALWPLPACAALLTAGAAWRIASDATEPDE